MLKDNLRYRKPMKIKRRFLERIVQDKDYEIHLKLLNKKIDLIKDNKRVIIVDKDKSTKKKMDINTSTMRLLLMNGGEQLLILDESDNTIIGPLFVMDNEVYSTIKYPVDKLFGDKDIFKTHKASIEEISFKKFSPDIYYETRLDKLA